MKGKAMKTAMAHDDEMVDDLPKKDAVDNLQKEVSADESKLAETRGKLGSAYKTAENDHGIHGPAFKLVQRLAKMDESKCAAFLRHFDHYRKQMIAETVDMFPPDDVKDNVVDMKTGKPTKSDAQALDDAEEVDDDLIDEVTVFDAEEDGDDNADETA
jgi:hypothetical protein